MLQTILCLASAVLAHCFVQVSQQGFTTPPLHGCCEGCLVTLTSALSPAGPASMGHLARPRALSKELLTSTV